MNIFVLDRDPAKAAEMMCDSHVLKMILESCQLLSTHDRLTERFEDPSDLYKSTHVDHPCRVCLENPMNRAWLICHLDALFDEYVHRFGLKTHKSAVLYHKYYYHSVFVPSMRHKFAHEDIAEQCTFPKCMAPMFREEGDDIDSVVRSYRNYYKSKRDVLPRFKYTKREMPDWLKEDYEPIV